MKAGVIPIWCRRDGEYFANSYKWGPVKSGDLSRQHLISGVRRGLLSP